MFCSAILVSRLCIFVHKHTFFVFFQYSQRELKGGNDKAGTNYKLICDFSSFEEGFVHIQLGACDILHLPAFFLLNNTVWLLLGFLENPYFRLFKV